jgi:AAA15 family ATPase/GTPase
MSSFFESEIRLISITGVNSSGKSSFIQSLLFFRENRENILAINQFNKGHS